MISTSFPRINVRIMGAVFAVALITGLLLTHSGVSARDGAQITACLQHGAQTVGYEVSTAKADLDLIAEKAGDRAMRVSWPRNAATIVVERNASDAKSTLRAYGLFKASLGGGPLERTGAVVVAYDKTPTAMERAAVDRCVRA